MLQGGAEFKRSGDVGARSSRSTAGQSSSGTRQWQPASAGVTYVFVSRTRSVGESRYHAERGNEVNERMLSRTRGEFPMGVRMRDGLLRMMAVGLSVLLCGRALAEETSGAGASEAEAVLKRFVGEWSTHTQIRKVGPPVKEFETRGKAECKATLGGRFFEFRSESVPAGESDLQVITYDMEAGVYRQWVFGSDGYTHQAEGKWYPMHKVLRWTGKSGDESFVIDDQWLSADRLDWNLQRKGADGQVLQTIRGTIRREK